MEFIGEERKKESQSKREQRTEESGGSPASEDGKGELASSAPSLPLNEHPNSKVGVFERLEADLPPSDLFFKDRRIEGRANGSLSSLRPTTTLDALPSFPSFLSTSFSFLLPRSSTSTTSLPELISRSISSPVSTKGKVLERKGGRRRGVNSRFSCPSLNLMDLG